MSKKGFFKIIIGTLIGLLLICFAIVLSFFVESRNNPRIVSWTFVNKSTIPITAFDTAGLFGVVRANGQTKFGYAQLDNNAKVTIRAYEFLPGEGSEFGWYDSQLGKTVVRKTSDHLVFCKVFSSKDLDFSNPKVTIDSTVQC